MTVQFEKEDIGRLQKALGAVRNTCLIDRIPIQHHWPIPKPNQIIDRANIFRDPVAKWKPLDNVWNIAGLQADETRNARVLAWYLDPEAGHGLGNSVLEQFLTYLGLSSAGHCRVMVEKYPNGQDASRVDIMLDDPAFVVIVEVKIRAREQPNQISRYSELAAQRAGPTRKWKVVYLTRTGKSAKTAPDNVEEIITMPWGMIARFLRQSTTDTGEVSMYLANRFAEQIEAKGGVNAHE